MRRIVLVALAAFWAAVPAPQAEDLAPASEPADARARWNELPEARKQELRERWRTFQSLPAAEQERIRANLDRLRSFAPERRAEIMRTYEVFERLPPRDRTAVLERFARFREMSPERRAEMRAELQKIVRSSSREQKRYLENLERWRDMRREDRERVRETWRERRR